ncbi:IclR family transcriptional regulator [Mycolicibacterium fortuitum]|jgi:DNA-binding IclR family transcriptional regulator|uniref:Helix-turn-helix domain-containing protein n=3 Tax=Mycolicibacterium fortuitum TaxID=1766 RepID=A0AAE4VIN8_MYCFO|nr:helix-turn-helix domain-containing protein [Mycolicibacterium fortuitum]MDO3239469.1 helix-turn-helix domain-containing protein [Mycobacteroides abscessus subsp. abscessus]MCA4756826.1 helix-turn-helix domain-containing protein [Mycolicibacterium fortuitum]MCV7138413.1 helix-turn-helix domain-containing protein [Mycolicibacterium fortuitum]MDV7194175.1 helix-turn-helix domain-containing protein [Mycolicibacterium fortuitum]MDV7208908.1 helix-turn-helix domain-containing protein [Mycolicibac
MPDAEPAGRASPPTARVVAILEFLSRHPQERFGLSELTRRVGLSKPTCLGILSTLADSGYLIRDSGDKTYRLGPGLISLGHAAQESMRVNPAARAELHALSATFNTSAGLTAVVDDRITVLELVGPPGRDPGVRVGQSYPFAPPVGLMFVLWDDEALQAWLAKAPTIPLRTESTRLQRVIENCRDDGYLVERLTPGGRRLYALMAGMSTNLPDELRALLSELVSDIGERVYLRDEGGSDGHDRWDISVISAPVFDHYRRQVMAASLHIGTALTDDEISDRARALVATADTLTEQLGGIKPTR